MEKQKIQMQREYREGRIQAIQDARRPSKIFFGFKQMIAEPDNASNEDDTKKSDKISNIESLDEVSSQDEETDIEQQCLPPNDHNQNRRIIRSRPRTRGFITNAGLLSDSETSDEYLRNHSLRGIGTFPSDYNENQGYSNDYCVDDDESSDSAVSSCSSVDSVELDFGYQYSKSISNVKGRHFLDGITNITNFDDDDNNAIPRKRRFKTGELITSDMLIDSDTDLEFSAEEDDDDLFEPEEIHLHRT